MLSNTANRCNHWLLFLGNQNLHLSKSWWSVSTWDAFLHYTQFLNNISIFLAWNSFHGDNKPGICNTFLTNYVSKNFFCFYWILAQLKKNMQTWLITDVWRLTVSCSDSQYVSHNTEVSLSSAEKWPGLTILSFQFSSKTHRHCHTHPHLPFALSVPSGPNQVKWNNLLFWQ